MPQQDPPRDRYGNWIVFIGVLIVGTTLIALTFWSFSQGEIKGAIGGAVLLGAFVIALSRPRWLRRFAIWYARVRG